MDGKKVKRAMAYSGGLNRLLELGMTSKMCNEALAAAIEPLRNHYYAWCLARGVKPLYYE